MNDIIENEIKLIEENYNLANLLALKLLLLNKNAKIDNISLKDLRLFAHGHWGCCPGINLCYSLINRYERKNKIKANIIIGTGHASPSVIVNMFINKQLEKKYPKYSYSYNGLNNLIKDFNKNLILQTEISPLLPDVIMQGGELGNAFNVALGTLLGKKQTTFLVMGDGEIEAGSSFGGGIFKNILASGYDGFLITIINVNNYKMSGPSLIGIEKNLVNILESFNFKVYTANVNEFKKLINIMDDISGQENLWHLNNEVKLPIILLYSNKGEPAPKKILNCKFAGTHNSHKMGQLSRPRTNKDNVDLIKEWFNQVNPSTSREELYECKNIDYNLENINKSLNVMKYKYSYDKSLYSSPMEGLASFLGKNIDENYYIFSPDESLSNRLDKIVFKNAVKYGHNLPKSKSSVPYRIEGKVVEILNEVACAAILFGHIRTGGDGVFVTYEAFAPIISSFLTQVYKFYKLIGTENGKQLNSFKIIITSLGWRNTYTHQNPDILNTLLGKDDELIDVYFPSETNQAIECYKKISEMKDKIQVIYLTKTEVIAKRKHLQSKKDVELGYWIEKKNKKNDNQKVLIFAVGDVITNECIKAIKELKNTSVVLFNIINLKSIKTINLNIKKYDKVLLYTTGYIKIFESYFSNYYDIREWIKRGYSDAICKKNAEVLELNKLSYENIIKDIEGEINDV